MLFSFVLAYPLNISAVDKDGTKLPNTLVQVLLGNTVLYGQNADANGTVQFDLAPGPYFIRLNRSFYPQHLLLYTMPAAPSQLQAVLLINRQSYILYGQVVDQPPSRWEGSTLSLLDANGRVVRTTTVHQDGYYILPYLDMGVTYQLRLEAGSHLLSAPFSFDQPNAFYLPLDLSSNTLLNTSPRLVAPSTSPLYYPITATLRAGAAGLANQSVSVQTPAGLLVLLTDENGAVKVNSAAPGDYVFRWANQTVTTHVDALVAPAPTNSEPAPPVAEPSAPSAPVSAASAPNDALSVGLGLGLLLLVIVGCFVVFMAVLGPRLHQMVAGKPQPPPASQTAPPPAAPPASDYAPAESMSKSGAHKPAHKMAHKPSHGAKASHGKAHKKK